MASATSPPAPQPPEINSALPGSVTEEVKSSPESKEDSPKDEKWAFLEPQPIREEQVKNAVNFLSHPRVRGSPIVHRRSFLERKGLSREEIDEAFRRVPDPPSNEAARNVISPEGKFTAPQPAQTKLGGTHQAVISAEPQPAVHQVTGASPLAMVQARARPHWSQLILGAGLLAAAGAGTGYFFQRVLVPKLKVWLREVVLEESTEGQIMKSRAIEEVKIEVQGKPVKLSPMEEAVGTATAAANAAAVAATEVANINRELLKSRTEEWKHLKSVLKSLENQTEELKSALTIMGRDPQALQGQVVSVTHGHTDEPVGANYFKGSVKAFQRTVSPAVQSQMRQGIQNNSKGMGLGNGMDRSQLPSNGHSAAFNNYVSHSEEEPWWRRKTREVETLTSPKQDAESTVQITEVDTMLDHEIGNPGPHTAGGGGQSRGGPWGRQGWVPPPVPQTVMPGAASAIRYQKPATVDEAKPSAVSEEKEMDSQASLGQSPEVPEVVEVAEASSVDKEIRSSSTKEFIEDGVQVLAETTADDEA